MPKHDSGRSIAVSMVTFERPTSGGAAQRIQSPADALSAGRPLSRRLTLSTAERADLERLAQHKPTGLARRAGMVLARAEGQTLSAIGKRFHAHPDTVRRWLARYEQRGLAGLRHGNLGKSRNLVFDAPLRAEIRRRAAINPAEFGENFPLWSLVKLRDHLVRHRVVRTMSHEALRQVLRGSSFSRRYWRASREPQV